MDSSSSSPPPVDIEELARGRIAPQIHTSDRSRFSPTEWLKKLHTLSSVYVFCAVVRLFRMYD